MMKKIYIRPIVVFEEMEEKACQLLNASQPDIDDPLTPPEELPEGGAEWGDDEDNI